MIRKIAILLFFFSFRLCLYGQLGKNNEGSLLYEKEWGFGLLLHTNGFGGNLHFCHMRHDGNFRLIDVNAYSVHNPKEISLPNPNNPDSRPYVFGKLNSFYAINAGYGSRIVLADIYAPNGVRINLNYSIGPMMGILKPVYYEIQATDYARSNTFEKFNPNDDNQHARIVGTDWTKGFNQLGVIFGAHGKLSFSFDFGNSELHYFTIEAGCIVDAFPQEVPIFAYINNDRVYTNLFLSFSYGIRY